MEREREEAFRQQEELRENLHRQQQETPAIGPGPSDEGEEDNDGEKGLVGKDVEPRIGVRVKKSKEVSTARSKQ